MSEWLRGVGREAGRTHLVVRLEDDVYSILTSTVRDDFLSILDDVLDLPTPYSLYTPDLPVSKPRRGETCRIGTTWGARLNFAVHGFTSYDVLISVNCGGQLSLSEEYP